MTTKTAIVHVPLLALVLAAIIGFIVAISHGPEHVSTAPAPQAPVVQEVAHR